ncbi:Eukaryotic peptide chain release factor GTP-binding subunit [Taphrina deformans PYCC 5710]|uniref:Eukaryotic peptide chain release factor GTP-binding subunit n=1 Tax=Taphrina deformans (strain PYCC 5710 / ATCC 11124 / CBS 356.35 / IMI 108563 / JCM 9778 / NBRC 8474) TaxID=1097556 RepID=R4X7Q6_TAPDE|nr:Eukaryotic peptide chain release factor GTP-binding subunit [Taphrina deformans PYCC 5710]|eukprot:CCG81208.1 Eukaryotic peptide chain release factor GTP-binding subunit [Taphrina deformans PYCC 5710]
MSNDPSQQPADSWEQEDDLARQTNNLNVSGRNFQPSAHTFQPSQGGFTPAFNPNAQSYGYNQGYNAQGYGGHQGYGQQQGGYGNQYNQYAQQDYNSYQQGGYNGYQQQQYQEPQTQVYDPSAKKKSAIPSLPAAKGPAKVLSLGSGPPKTLSLGSGPAKTVSIGSSTPQAKSVSLPSTDSAKPPAKTVALPSAEKKTPAKPAEPAANATESPKTDTPVTKAAPEATSSASKIEKAAEKRQENIIKAQVAEAKQQEEALDEDLLAEVYGKEHVSIVFIGHVDAGKSTLGGQLLILTGMVDQRTVDKYRREAAEMGRESWVFSWALDSTKQERTKGITVEVGRAHFETEKRSYSILDAPGHKSFVPNMIGGASQADVGVLVISARSGEYEAGFEKGGQTREHAILAKTQGVNKLIVVINKMDDPTVGWSKERYDECTTKLGTFLRREAGYNPKTDVVFMPISAFTGAGLKERVDPKDCPWYSGPSLIEYLDSMQSFERKINAALMMPISTKWKDLGTILEGKLESGHIKKGNKVLMMPGEKQLEVTTIYNETEEEVDGALCGEQVRLRVKGVEEEDVLNGFVITSLKSPVHTVTSFEAQIVILELGSLLTAGFSCVMHVHTAIEEVSFTALLHKLDKTNRKSKAAPAFAKQGMKIIARLETTQPVCLEKFSDFAQLGRFTLRDSGITIAIGKVTKLVS